MGNLIGIDSEKFDVTAGEKLTDYIFNLHINQPFNISAILWVCAQGDIVRKYVRKPSVTGKSTAVDDLKFIFYHQNQVVCRQSGGMFGL